MAGDVLTPPRNERSVDGSSNRTGGRPSVETVQGTILKGEFTGL